MLTTDEMRFMFARELTRHATKTDAWDIAFDACIQAAYEAGIEAGNVGAMKLMRDLLDPEGYGHAVTGEVREAARRVLGINR